jgi:hypothetical protein
LARREEEGGWPMPRDRDRERWGGKSNLVILDNEIKVALYKFIKALEQFR